MGAGTYQQRSSGHIPVGVPSSGQNPVANPRGFGTHSRAMLREGVVVNIPHFPVR